MRLAWLILGGIWLAGCGASSKPVVKAAPVASAPETVVERHPYAELAPAQAPGGLDGVWLRANSIQKLSSELPVLLKGVPPFDRLQELVDGRGGLIPAEVAAVVDVSQPIDLLLPLGGAFPLPPVISFQVRSAEAVAAGKSGLTLRRASAGIWDVGGVVDAPVEAEPEEDAEEAEEDEDAEQEADAEPQLRDSMSCQLRHLPAPLGYRVLCSLSPIARDAAVPFLLAPARASSSTSDLHLEVSGPGYAKFREEVLNRVRQGEEPPDPGRRAGREFAQELMDNLFSHERVALDASLSNLHARLSLDLTYSENAGSAGFAQWLAQSSKANLPTSYNRLRSEPGLALGMSWGAALVEAIVQGFEKSLDEETLTAPKEKQQLLEALRGILPSDGRLSLALGGDVAAMLEALESPAVRLSDDADRPLSAAAARQLQSALGGWLVLGVEEPPARYLPAVRRAYQAGRLKSKPRPGHEEKNRRSIDDLVKLSGAPRGLPKETLHVTTQVRPDPKYVPPPDGKSPAILPYSAHILFVPERDRVWIVYARSEDVAVRQAQLLLASPAAGASPGNVPAVFSASVPIAQLALADVEFDSKSEREAARRRLSAINRAPGQARLAVPLSMQVVPRDGAPGWVLRLQSSAQLDELLAQGVGLVPAGE